VELGLSSSPEDRASDHLICSNTLNFFHYSQFRYKREVINIKIILWKVAGNLGTQAAHGMFMTTYNKRYAGNVRGHAEFGSERILRSCCGELQFRT
jgi:hypothetical protein